MWRRSGGRRSHHSSDSSAEEIGVRVKVARVVEWNGGGRFVSVPHDRIGPLAIHRRSVKTNQVLKCGASRRIYGRPISQSGDGATTRASSGARACYRISSGRTSTDLRKRRQARCTPNLAVLRAKQPSHERAVRTVARSPRDAMRGQRAPSPKLRVACTRRPDPRAWDGRAAHATTRSVAGRAGRRRWAFVRLRVQAWDHVPRRHAQ
jgi:hypothetical protein